MSKKFSIMSGLENPKLSSQLAKKPSTVNHFQVEFDGHTINVDIAHELRIDENDLVSEMTRHAGNFGWWAGLNTTAKRYLRSIEKAREATIAGLDMQARASLQERGMKVTEVGVSAFIKSDPRTTEGSEDIAMLKDIVEFTDMMIRGLEHRRDMLREVNRAQLGERYSERG